jgi:hypothetical protein
LVKVTLKAGAQKGMGGLGKSYGGCHVLLPLCIFDCICIVVVERACVRDYSGLGLCKVGAVGMSWGGECVGEACSVVTHWGRI